MTRGRWTVFVLITMIVAGCGGSTVETADEAYRQLLEQRKVTDAIEDRMAMTKAFLAEFPESKHSATAIDAVAYYQGESLGDATGAIEYAEAIRARVDDPDIGQAVDKVLLDLYGRSGATDAMLALADRLVEAGALDFADHWNIIESGVKAGDWRLVRSYCAKAREMAGPEACRAEYPDRDFTEAELVETVNNRVGMLLVKDSWARANQGEFDEVLADFATADQLVPRYYFGIPEYDLNVYWGRTLIMRGRFEEAIGRLAVAGLVMRHADALAAIEEAYIGMNGDRSGFETYTTELHQSLARVLDDFEMADYKGERQSFSDLRGDVTVLTFWYPT